MTDFSDRYTWINSFEWDILCKIRNQLKPSEYSMFNVMRSEMEPYFVEMLEIDNDELTELPLEIKSYTHLKKLIIRAKQIKIQNWVWDLGLISLQITGIKEIEFKLPENLRLLQEFRSIGLSGAALMRLTVLPPDFSELIPLLNYMPNLEHLHWRNGIISLRNLRPYLFQIDISNRKMNYPPNSRIDVILRTDRREVEIGMIRVDINWPAHLYPQIPERDHLFQEIVIEEANYCYQQTRNAINRIKEKMAQNQRLTTEELWNRELIFFTEELEKEAMKYSNEAAIEVSDQLINIKGVIRVDKFKILM